MATVSYYLDGKKSEPVEVSQLPNLIKQKIIRKDTLIEVKGQTVEAYRIKQLKPLFDSLPPDEEELTVEEVPEKKEEKTDEKKPQMPKGCSIGCLGFIILFGLSILYAHLNPTPYDDPARIEAAAQRVIKEHLLSPSGAKFPLENRLVNKIDEKHAVVIMNVKSKNAFGVEITNRATANLYWDGNIWVGDPSKAEPVIFNIP